MSFFLDLEVEGLTEEQAQAVEAACRERGAWPVAKPPLLRRRFQGFALRATWVGSKVRQERLLSSDDLAELVLASQLNEFTRYRVPARGQESSE